ncbi:hypothetical protein [Roseicyclus mahoneyensis]|uniref:Uncharacterized protein n=1 Tax=Roseicyclus mahoneyensis TaxID=164332 RepID=A0A316GHW4_9RHOB|nr:hypothetical protein [Roseicyclus mahoneyensis]PWK60603.1 hypothetical protein C7455_104240 [Roseicyclus mahoneyensis]
MSTALAGKPIAAFWPEDWPALGLAQSEPVDPCAERGLYFSTYVGTHRVLHLDGEGRFTLFLWRTDRNGLPEARRQSRHEGAARIVRFGDGDRRLDLDLENAPPAVRWDAALYLVGTGCDSLLLRKRSMHDLAVSIGWNSTLGESERYFSRYRDLKAVPDYRHVGRQAPPLADLPKSIRGLVLRDPIVGRIMQVFDPPGADDPDTTAPVMVVIDKGRKDGVRHNMPFAAPAGAERHLIGWCSAPEARSCAVRVKVNRRADGTPTGLPQVGDIVTSRAPSAPPLA